jgi:hypothetical protein
MLARNTLLQSANVVRRVMTISARLCAGSLSIWHAFHPFHAMTIRPLLQLLILKLALQLLGLGHLAHRLVEVVLVDGVSVVLDSEQTAAVMLACILKRSRYDGGPLTLQ